METENLKYYEIQIEDVTFDVYYDEANQKIGKILFLDRIDVTKRLPIRIVDLIIEKLVNLINN